MIEAGVRSGYGVRDPGRVPGLMMFCILVDGVLTNVLCVLVSLGVRLALVAKFDGRIALGSWASD